MVCIFFIFFQSEKTKINVLRKCTRVKNEKKISPVLDIHYPNTTWKIYTEAAVAMPVVQKYLQGLHFLPQPLFGSSISTIKLKNYDKRFSFNFLRLHKTDGIKKNLQISAWLKYYKRISFDFFFRLHRTGEKKHKLLYTIKNFKSNYKRLSFIFHIFTLNILK